MYFFVLENFRPVILSSNSFVALIGHLVSRHVYVTAGIYAWNVYVLFVVE